MPVEECTVTLQDVEVLVGLPVDGEPVTDQRHDDCLHVCQELLGATSPSKQIRGSRLSLTWLGAEFPRLADDADEETITRYAQAYILQLMGESDILGVEPVWYGYIDSYARHPNKSLSIGTCLIFFNLVRLSGSRIKLSYIACHISVRTVTTYGGRLVLSYVFYIDEWHHLDRVLRQFGIQQAVPRGCNTEPLLRFIATGPPIKQFDMNVSQEYIHWYKNITKLDISQPGAAMGHLVLNICNDNEQYMENIHYMYDVLIIPAPVQRRRVLVQEPDQLEEVDQHVEEVPPVTQT
ncbi:mediator of RNA polymerase II transcription subunit 12-like isoform X1 [Cucumis melo var. makuwa]|uniref:Mediator of RNA polymerase II transcription subunit 12-like isoform X1 n=1 Tax=Cucumis melo var. makuwa TaxID=1194695 RepID=A0A5D3D6I1_CUCMM|nr:mediator of RNA polymerase II transcription subunit 12-like isoform X1 [Cucumis melo var. makuwa]TYK19158.1 mediator of RNA polymerase II transcription subunit 12-like isoform X1 [Cucumis melo var. makuwa]